MGWLWDLVQNAEQFAKETEADTVRIVGRTLDGE